MPAYVSPLDGRYLSLKRAALLLADEHPGVTQDEIMETFTRALFIGEFTCEETALPGAVPDDDGNMPLLRIEAPCRNNFVPSLPLDAQPQEYFAVSGLSIAVVLCERGALPGRPEDWATFAQWPRSPAVEQDTLHALAHIPYPAFPEPARALLGGIMLAKAKLRAWMLFKGYALPRFLEGEDAMPFTLAGQATATSGSPSGSSTSDASRGRPRKAGWPRIEELIRGLHAANPDLPRDALAYDAHKMALREFDEKDLPSRETITRQMKSILRSAG